MTPSASSILWFVAILAAIPAVLWLVKRSPIGRLHGLAAQGPGAMRAVSTLVLSPSQRIVTVEVGQGAERRWLVLGVTPASIQTLHTLEPPDLGTARAAGPVPPAAHTGGEASALPAALEALGAAGAPPGSSAAVLPFSQWLARLRGDSPPATPGAPGAAERGHG